MSHLQALILGAIQGLTEFLPVSSSGHLVLGQYFLGLREPAVFFDLVLHLGTLVATLVFFWSSFRGMAVDGVRGLGDKARGTSWREVFARRPDARLLWLVIVGSVPTALMGLLFRHQLEESFADVRALGWQLLVTAALLLVTAFVKREGRDIQRMTVWDALVIGVAQGVAIIPAISRSGTTIAAGLLLGLDRELAGRYSFVLSVPAIAGAFLLELVKAEPSGASAGSMIIGFVSSVVLGLAALAFLMPVVRRGRLYLFAGYLLPLALVTIWFVR